MFKPCASFVKYTFDDLLKTRHIQSLGAKRKRNERWTKAAKAAKAARKKNRK